MKEVLGTYCEVLQAHEKMLRNSSDSIVKKKIFSFFYSIISNCYFSHYIYIFIMAIETSQLLFPLIYESRDDSILTTIMLFGAYPFKASIFGAYCIFTAIVWATSLLILVVSKDIQWMMASSFIATNALPKIIGTVVIIYKCIFFLPSTLVLVEVFNCSKLTDSSLSCMSPLHIVLIFASSILLVLNFAGVIMFTIFMNISYDEPGIPFAQRSILIPILKTVEKLSLVISLTVDSSVVLLATLIVALACCTLIIVITIYTTTYKLTYFEIGFQTILVWYTIFEIIKQFMTLNLSNFSMWIPILIIIWILIECKKYNSSRHYAKFGRTWSENESKMKLCTNEILNLLKNNNKKAMIQNHMNLSGILSSHIRVCPIAGCECERPYLFCHEDKMLGQIKSRSQSFSMISTEFLANIKEDDNKNFKNNVCNVLTSSLDHWELYHGKSTEICMEKAIINEKYLLKKFRALFELTRTSLLKPTILQEFSIYSLKAKIYKKIMQNESREVASSKFSLQTIIKYHTTYIKMHKAIANSLDITNKFWTELKLSKPSFKKIMKHSENQFEKSSKVRRLKQVLESLYGHDIRGSVIYALYLSIIEQDKMSAYEQSLKVKMHLTMNKLTYDENDEKYGPNSTVSVCVINGNEDKIGKIIDANNDLTNLFGYMKKDIINMNVSCLMPVILGNFHNGFIIKSLLRDERALQKGLVVESIGLHARGFIFPVSIIVKVKFSITKGIVHIGFIRHAHHTYFPKDSFVMLLSSQKIIEGMNIEFTKIMRTNSNEVTFLKYISSEKKPNISELYPHMFRDNQLVDMSTVGGVVENLDLTSLRNTIIQLNGLTDNSQDESRTSSEKDTLMISGDFNVRIKKYTFGELEYYLLTISIFINQSAMLSKIEDATNNSEVLQGSKKDSVEKIAFEEGNMSVTSASTRIPFMQ